jgi:protein O-mannosyl-transferase
MEKLAKYYYVNRRECLYIFIILCITFASYFTALSNGFAFDDVFLVYQNPVIRSWHNIPHLFAMDYWEHAGFKNTGLYRPLTMLSFLLEYSIVGLRPFLYHLDNFTLHFLCSILVYFTLKLMLKEDKVPFLTAMLFAVHPVHTEAVAWVSGRAELLWSFFALLSALFFLKKPVRPISVVLASLFFLLALLSKEGAIVLPVILAAYLVLFEKPDPGQSRASLLLRRLYPYALVFVIYMPVRLLVLGALGPTGFKQVFVNVTGFYSFLFMCKSFTHYIRLSFLPFSLAAEYFFLPPDSLSEFVAFLPPLIIVLTIVFARRIMRFSKTAFFGILVFFIALFPVSNIIPVGILMSERAMYIPVLGPCLILGVAFSKVAGCESLKNGRRYAILMIALILLIFGVNTAKRNPFWHDQRNYMEFRVKMVTHMIELIPNYQSYYFLLAEAYVGLDNYGPEAEKAALEAIRLGPKDHDSHFLLARIYLHQSRLDEALAEAMTAVGINPEDPETLNLASNILRALHRDKEAEMLSGEALKQIDIAIRRSPDNGSLYKMQGIILGSKRRYTEAIEKLRKADELSPETPEIHYLLGVAYFGADQLDAARAELQKALELKPGYKEASDLLQQVL